VFAEYMVIERALLTAPGREWLTVEEATVLAPYSPQTIRRWCRAYRLLFTRHSQTCAEERETAPDVVKLAEI
jgi:hypothetical protein